MSDYDRMSQSDKYELLKEGGDNMNDFLPSAYEVPSKENGYMKLKKGDNRFRILTKPILGWEWWEDTAEGGRRPQRVRMDEGVSVATGTEAKHFWAFVVWNYQANALQILELTQKGLQRAIKGLWQDQDWGSPLNYDLVISREGEGLETEYELKPKPAKALDNEIFDKFKEATINLEALYDGADPFSTEAKPQEIVNEVVDEEEVEKVFA